MGAQRTMGARRPAVTHGPADIVQVCSVLGEDCPPMQHANSLLAACWSKAAWAACSTERPDP